MIFHAQLVAALERAEARFMSARPGRFIALAVGLAVAYSLFCFCPKLRLLTGSPLDGTFEWTRAITFLEQCKAPLDLNAVREPAMRWRVLPALVAHGLHLGPAAAWLVPWLGILACLAHAAGTMLRLTGDRTLTVLTICLLSGSGGIITATNLLGINDAWVMLGLNVVAFSPSAWAIMVAGLLTPWVDERFLIALPLAVACRMLLTPSTGNWTGLVGVAMGVVLYLGVRLTWEAAQPRSTSGQFIKDSLGSLGAYWRWIPLGWWMGFRAAWLFILLPLVAARKDCAPAGQWLLWGGIRRGVAADHGSGGGYDPVDAVADPAAARGCLSSGAPVGRYRSSLVAGAGGARQCADAVKLGHLQQDLAYHAAAA